MIDLHVHTTASDGSDTPRQVAEKAAALGLSAIAVTDHDTAAGIAEAVSAGAEWGVEIVPGIEISADYQNRRAHILGLFIDPEAPALRSAVEWAVNERRRRNEQTVKALAAHGICISMEALCQAYPHAVLGRPHIADYLMKQGLVSSIREGFTNYLGEGAPFCFPKKRMPMKDAVEAICSAGGIAILAHPLQYGYAGETLDAFIRAGRDAGAAGLEAYYSEHSEADRIMVQRLADRYGMAVSGGSDYHGSRKPHIELGTGINGTLHVPDIVLENLKGLLRKP